MPAPLGNNNPGVGADRRWREALQKHGFDSEREGLILLHRDHSVRALKDLFRVSRQTMQKRLKKYGIEPHPPGGRNNKWGWVGKKGWANRVVLGA